MNIDPEIAARVFGSVGTEASLQAMGFTFDTAGFRAEDLQPCITVPCPPFTDVTVTDVEMIPWDAVCKCPDGGCR